MPQTLLTQNMTHITIGGISYQIRTDNNSSNRKAVEKYTTALKSCNSSFQKGYAILGGSIDIVAALVIIAANIAIPPAAIVTIVVAAIGGTASGIKFLIDSHKHFLDMKDYYISARACGQKYS